MTAFRCVPIATEIADRFRQSGRDDAGNALRHIVAARGGGYPCRHCLQLARPGEDVLLGSYNLPQPRGIYWTPSPIFVHAAACLRFDAVDQIAPIMRENSLVSLRAYDAEDQCVYDLGQVCEGTELDGPLGQALDDPRMAFINVHTARPGCLLSRIERAV